MNEFAREKATHQADLPHPYAAEVAGATSDSRCDLCDRGLKDPLHVSWERQRLRDREVAQAEFFRELGS